MSDLFFQKPIVNENDVEGNCLLLASQLWEKDTILGNSDGQLALGGTRNQCSG
ncbi:MAG: hypothetical protein HY774_18095 [Acidobacteria bacterium]|nr:hypothetical protein [Acidobacteriota bacterium]